MKLLSFERLLLFFLIAISIVATYISYTNNFVLTYNDAASHLNIGRRVVDSLTPGIAQIGTVWLPLPHVLMIPFAVNDVLWNTGLAGSIVSMLAYIFSTVAIYKLLKLITNNVYGAVIGAAVFALNPNLLYFQSTPMTEPLLLASIIVAIYYFVKYIKGSALVDLILCAIFVSASTLIRYDGWFLFLSLSLLIPFLNLFLKGRRKAESALVLFLSLGGLGIFLWFLWNLTIFGDAFYFISGPYSAAAQQKVLKSVGQLPTQGNVLTASFYYMWSVIENNGLFITIGAVLGLFITPFILKNKSMIVVVGALLTPIIFNIIALFMGQSAMNILQAPDNPGLFNIRYGMMALPAIAIILGIVATNKYLRILVVALVLFQSVLFFQQGQPITLRDGLGGLKNTYYTIEASAWLKENYEGGLILTSLASHDAFVARTQIPMKNYIHEGTREYWHNALKQPSKDATYITVLTDPPDLVYRDIIKTQDFKDNFVLIHSYGKFEIYKKR